MNTKKVLRKIHDEINAFNESGGREDKACAEGLRRARQIIQIESLKAKVLNENQQVVLEWLKEEKEERCSFESAIYWYFEDDVEPDIISDRLTQIEFLQVLQAFAEWGMKEVAE